MRRSSQAVNLAAMTQGFLFLRRIPRIAIHLCPKMVTFESGPKMVVIDEIW